jgi:cation-transporting P-type ATPase E
VAFAVGVIRLARRRCLVQQLSAVEVLARVDVLCVDKTGTLTAPDLDLAGIRLAAEGQLDSQTEVRQVLAALAGTDPQPNPTMRALTAGSAPGDGWRAIASVPFSSARKFSAVTFAGRGSWVLGAPDVILAADEPQRGDALGREGLRVVALGLLPDEGLPVDGRLGTVQPVALVVLRQRLCPEAGRTLAYLTGEGVAVKVLSGDNATSVGAVAAMLGLPGADAPMDARQLPDDVAALAGELARHTVFGRVTPQQKQDIVAALRAQGHTVAMTGDGVNDALALKDADLGIAMGPGSPASRAVAKVVLLDDSFAALPAVLAEGRRVLGNIERVAGLFLIKTMYALLLAVLVGLAHVPFPFLPGM